MPAAIAPPAITQSAPEKSINLIPLSISTDASPRRSVRSRTLRENWLERRIPGMEPERRQAMVCRSTLPANRCPKPATQRSAAAWKMSVPTIFRQRQRENEHHHEPEERPAADRGQAYDEAARCAERKRDQPVAPRQQERSVVGLHSTLDEGLGDEGHPADHERCTDRVGLDRLRSSVVVLEPRGDADAEQRHRARAQEHPEREPRVDGAEAPVPDGTEALE